HGQAADGRVHLRLRGQPSRLLRLVAGRQLGARLLQAGRAPLGHGDRDPGAGRLRRGARRARRVHAPAHPRRGAGVGRRAGAGAEWQKACEGPSPSPTQWSFSSAPSVYLSGVCNDAKLSPTPAPWVTGTVGPSGKCFVRWTPSPSPSPIFDLSGNLKEWTSTA